MDAASVTGGAHDGRPRQSRIFRMASGEWIAATIFIRPRQRGQPRLIPTKRIRFFRIALRPHATTIEQLGNSLSERRREARNFIIVRSQQDLKLWAIVFIGRGSSDSG